MIAELNHPISRHSTPVSLSPFAHYLHHCIISLYYQQPHPHRAKNNPALLNHREKKGQPQQLAILKHTLCTRVRGNYSCVPNDRGDSTKQRRRCAVRLSMALDARSFSRSKLNLSRSLPPSPQRIIKQADLLHTSPASIFTACTCMCTYIKCTYRDSSLVYGY